MLGKAASGDDVRVGYLANTYQQARDIIWNDIKKFALGMIVSVNESRLELTVRTKNGGTSTIVLKGWESVDMLRGLKFHFLVMDEVASMKNYWANWQEIVRPTLTDYRGEALFLSTPKGFNHWYDLFNLQVNDKDYRSFHFTSYDNPHIPKDELDKARQELTEDRFAQEYLADFRKTEGLVFKEFDRHTHVFEDLKRIKTTVRKMVGIDWGFTNPAAITEIHEDADRNYYVVSEWYKQGKTTEEITEYAASLKANAYYPDPAEPDRIEELKRKKLNVKDVNKDVAAGIDSVRALFKNNKLFIHQSCVNLISELESYAYREGKAGVNEPEQPVKDHDHAIDSLRYVLHMAPQKTASFKPRVFAY